MLVALLALGVGCCAGGAYKYAQRSKSHSLLKRQKQIDLLRRMAVTFNPNPQTLILARTPTPSPSTATNQYP